MNAAQYQHPVLLAVFLGIFTVLCLIGIFKLARHRQYFGVTLLFISAVVLGYSTYIAATLHLS